MKRAILLPGQGAQHVGMGSEFLDEKPARDVFERASGALDLDLAALCSEGPEAELGRTEVCQPAILTTSIAILEAARARGASLDAIEATAGLSLGEYTALVFAGALEFEDAVRLVRKRGRYMQECSDAKPSGMVSLLGADEETAAKICDKAREGDVAGVANLNGAGQVVVSGDTAAMERVVEIAGEFGIRRAIPLKVSGAFHSELMRGAADQLESDLADIEIRSPRITFLSNVTGAPVTDPEAIRKHLGEQVCSPVRWEQTMQWLVAEGFDTFVEPGPGKVLSGLAKKIERSATVLSIGVPDDVAGLGEALAASDASAGGSR